MLWIERKITNKYEYIFGGITLQNKHFVLFKMIYMHTIYLLLTFIECFEYSSGYKFVE